MFNVLLQYLILNMDTTDCLKHKKEEHFSIKRNLNFLVGIKLDFSGFSFFLICLKKVTLVRST